VLYIVNQESGGVIEMKKIVISFFCVMLVVLMILGITTPVTVNAAGGKLRVGPGQPYSTIQEAVDDAKQGAKILVYPGYYEENVYVQTNNLQIIAESDGVTVYSPTEGEAPFTVHADHVTIRGFNELTGVEECVPGIVFEGSYNTFEGNVINPGSCPGVHALVCIDQDGGSNYNRIENNTIMHADLGIVITAWEALNIGNIIKNNTINEIAQNGIAVENGIGFTISGNRITQSTFGDSIMVTADNNISQGYHHITYNTVQRSAGDGGIALYAWDNTKLSHNLIAHNDISGGISMSEIFLYADPGATVSNNLIMDNYVTDNSFNGIMLLPGVNNNRIFNNKVTYNWANGIVVESDNNKIIGNTSLNNDLLDLVDTGEGNLWRNNEYETSNWE
jgi:parallel beta-helix repeat protein